MQELLQEKQESKPEYLDWMSSLQSKVKQLDREERMEQRMRGFEVT